MHQSFTLCKLCQRYVIEKHPFLSFVNAVVFDVETALENAKLMILELVEL